MTFSHANCTHPATSRDRALCRKAADKSTNDRRVARVRAHAAALGEPDATVIIPDTVKTFTPSPLMQRQLDRDAAAKAGREAADSFGDDAFDEADYEALAMTDPRSRDHEFYHLMEGKFCASCGVKKEHHA